MVWRISVYYSVPISCIFMQLPSILLYWSYISRFLRVHVQWCCDIYIYKQNKIKVRFHHLDSAKLFWAVKFPRCHLAQDSRPASHNETSVGQRRIYGAHQHSPSTGQLQVSILNLHITIYHSVQNYSHRRHKFPKWSKLSDLWPKRIASQNSLQRPFRKSWISSRVDGFSLGTINASAWIILQSDPLMVPLQDVNSLLQELVFWTWYFLSNKQEECMRACSLRPSCIK